MGTPSKLSIAGFRPGIAAHNGKLYVYAPYQMLVIRGWPEMRAWTMSARERQWKCCRPEIDLGRFMILTPYQPHNAFATAAERERPFTGIAKSAEWRGPKSTREWLAQRQAAEHQMVADYFSPVPEPVREVVKGFRLRQWHTLVLAARCQGAVDLLLSNPALAWALASCWAFGVGKSGGGVRTMRRLANRKRREICGALGFPETEAAVAAFAKIPPESCSLPLLFDLKRLLWIPEARAAISRLPVVNAAVLKVIASPWINSAVSTKFITELSQLKPEKAHWVLTFTLCGVLTMTRWAKRDPKSLSIASIAQLRTTYGRLNEEANSREKPPEKEFPKPPIEGTENIIPLLNKEMLVEEGREMRNCAGGYGAKVQHGASFLYRVLSPGRATVMITKSGSGRCWYLAEIAGPANEPVGDEVVFTVLRWLYGSTMEGGIVLPPDKRDQ